MKLLNFIISFKKKNYNINILMRMNYLKNIIFSSIDDKFIELFKKLNFEKN